MVLFVMNEEAFPWPITILALIMLLETIDDPQRISAELTDQKFGTLAKLLNVLLFSVTEF